MTGNPSDWPSAADLDALVDSGEIASTAGSPVAKLAADVVTQLERTLGGIGDTMVDVPWQSDVEALADVRRRIEGLAEAGEVVALPALDRLLRELDRAGQPDFVQRVLAWCSDVDHALESR